MVDLGLFSQVVGFDVSTVPDCGRICSLQNEPVGIRRLAAGLADALCVCFYALISRLSRKVTFFSLK